MGRRSGFGAGVGTSTAQPRYLPHGLGLVAMLVYGLYGAYIATLYVLTGDKGGMRSADFVLFLIVVVLLATTDLWRRLVSRTLRGGVRTFLLLALVAYIAVMLVLEGGGTEVFNLRHLATELGKYFLVGFVAFGALRSRVFPLSWIAALSTTLWGRRRLAAIVTSAFFLAMLAFLMSFVGSPMAKGNSFTAIGNDYYQMFGDYVTIAYCCLVAAQVSYVREQSNSALVLGVFAAVLWLQAVVVFLAAQAVTSNKAVLVVALVSAAALYRCWPRRRPVVTAVAVTAGVLMMVGGLRLAINVPGLPALDETQFRVTDYGERAFYETSSVLSRLEQLRELGMGQLLGAPFFGNIGITTYLHSSVLSLQTHLGLVGSALFWGFVLLQLRRLYRSNDQDGLQVVALPLLFVAAISSFFTWGPLWFLMGGLFQLSSSRPSPEDL